MPFGFSVVPFGNMLSFGIGGMLGGVGNTGYAGQGR
jgi:hypothetical protein